ncbi:MAG: alpha/beta hydrolase [Desulfobacterales bacterium]|nr:alpha/beta hydrolase [Desulfobacterales bacterium]
MPFVTVNGIKHHYMQQGSGPDVVLIHGMGGNISFWHANKALAALKSNFRVTVYDLRGHGYSDFVKSGYTSKDLSEDLGALLDAVGVQKACLAGHSLGGLVALHTAYLYPARVAGIVMAEGNVPALRHLIDLDKWSFRQQRDDMLREIDPRLPEMVRGQDIFYLEYRLKNAKKEIGDSDLNQFGLRKGMAVKGKGVLRLLEETTIKKDVRDMAGLTEACIRTVTQPTLALYGEYSPLIPISEYLRDHLSNCTQEIIPKACHLFPARMPDNFVNSLGAFLFKVAKAAPYEVHYAAHATAPTAQVA